MGKAYEALAIIYLRHVYGLPCPENLTTEEKAERLEGLTIEDMRIAIEKAITD